MQTSGEQSNNKKARLVVKRTDRLLIAWDIIICIIFAVVGVLVAYLVPGIVNSFPRAESQAQLAMQFVLGVLLGCVSSVVKIILMRISLEKILDMEKDGAASRGKLHAFGRFGVTLCAVIVAICLPRIFDIFGLVAGILSLQLAALIVSRYPMENDKFDSKGNKLYFHSKKRLS